MFPSGLTYMCMSLASSLTWCVTTSGSSLWPPWCTSWEDCGDACSPDRSPTGTLLFLFPLAAPLCWYRASEGRMLMLKAIALNKEIRFAGQICNKITLRFNLLKDSVYPNSSFDIIREQDHMHWYSDHFVKFPPQVWQEERTFWRQCLAKYHQRCISLRPVLACLPGALLLGWCESDTELPGWVCTRYVFKNIFLIL